jgi:hypothetical protein
LGFHIEKDYLTPDPSPLFEIYFARRIARRRGKIKRGVSPLLNAPIREKKARG